MTWGPLIALITGVVALIAAVVKARGSSLARGMSLRQAAAGTAEWQEAGRVLAARERDKQRAFHGAELFLWGCLPGHRIEKVARGEREELIDSAEPTATPEPLKTNIG